MADVGDEVKFLETSGIGKTWKHIDKVRDSYNTGFGVIAEPVQNSVDAIRQFDENYYSVAHEIDILIDSDSLSFAIRDDGLGMDIESAPEYASPNETDKTFAQSTIGEMGVGFTYLTFSTNELIVESKSKRPESEGHSGYIKYEVKDAYDWFERYKGIEDPDLKEMEDSMPTATIIDKKEVDSDAVDPSETYTKIIAKDVKPVPIVGIDDESDDKGETFFEFSENRLEYYLRTETALGNTRQLLGKEVESVYASVWFDDISKDFASLGEDDGLSISCEYKSPDQFWNETGIIDLTEDADLKNRFENVHDHQHVTTRDQVTVMDDSSKEKIFSERPWVMYSDVPERGTDDLFYYAIFFPKREMFDEIGEELVDGLELWDVSSGIYVATKGMPTSEEVPTPTRTAEAGYWSNVFILFNYDSIDYDYGRKAAQSRTRGMFREIAGDVFDEFRNFTQFASRDIKDIEDPNEELMQLADVDDLNTDDIPWRKEPNGQEASVMMIFSELVSQGVLEKYEGWRAGLKTTYDWLGKYTGDTQFKEENITIEFKPHTENIEQDVEEGIKKVSEIDIIVAWDIDVDKMEDEYSWKVGSADDSERNVYQGVNYKISKSTVRCWVISLSELIENL